MPEISIEVDDDVALLAGQLDRDEIRRIVTTAFRERASEELMYDVADEILRDSELSDEAVEEMATDLKRRVAERHRRDRVA